MQQIINCKLIEKIFFIVLIHDLSQSTGVPQSLFDEMVTYLEPFQNRFKSFDLSEVLTMLLVHLRHGDSFNYLHAAINRIRPSNPVKLETISKSIRKALIIMVGPNPYLKETQLLFLKKTDNSGNQSDDEQEPQQNPNQVNAGDIGQQNARNCYYAGPTFDGLREGTDIGRFYSNNVGWFAQDMDTIITEGTSWFDLGIHGPLSLIHERDT